MDNYGCGEGGVLIQALARSAPNGKNGKAVAERTILIASDEPETAEIWGIALGQRGITAETGALDRQSVQQFAEGEYVLGIIDVNNDGIDIGDFCRSVRAVFDNPIIALSYNPDERFHLHLYKTGVDESLTKPIGVQLLLAKVAAWLARSSMPSSDSSPFEADGIHLSASEQSLVTADGRLVKLSKLEYRLMLMLLANRGTAVPSELLVSRIWGTDDMSSRGSLKRLVYRLRQKIEPDPGEPRYVKTVTGDGYGIPHIEH